MSIQFDHFPILLRHDKVFTGEVPFKHDSSVTAMVAIIHGERPPRPTHNELTEELWELIRQCWVEDQHERPQMSRVLEVLDSIPRPKSPCASQQLEDPEYTDGTRRSSLTEHPNGSLPTGAGALIPASAVERRSEEAEPSNQEISPSDEEVESGDEEFHPCLEISHPSDKVPHPPDEVSDLFNEASDPPNEVFDSNPESDSSAGELDPFIEDYQHALLELSGHKDPKPRIDNLRAKAYVGLIELLDEVGSLSI